jgi:leader peptidase (prepilin peptidase)/N-methyltransferase
LAGWLASLKGNPSAVDFLQWSLLGSSLAFALGAVVGGCLRRYTLRLLLPDEQPPWYTLSFGIELLTGVSFAVFFWLEVVVNIHDVPQPAPGATVPLALVIIWLFHAVLLGLLLATALSNAVTGEIPLQLTIPGALFGILAGTLAPWPWPVPVVRILPEVALGPPRDLGLQEVLALPGGLQPWPVAVWSLDWLSPGSWSMGLATSLTGALVGTGLIRLVRLLYGWASGQEALGIGIADQMMMVGAFLGWQAVVLVFPLAFVACLAYSMVAHLAGRTDSQLAFAPFVAAATAVTVLFCHWMAAAILPALFVVLGGSLALSVIRRLSRKAAHHPGLDDNGRDSPAELPGSTDENGHWDRPGGL